VSPIKGRSCLFICLRNNIDAPPDHSIADKAEPDYGNDLETQELGRQESDNENLGNDESYTDEFNDEDLENDELDDEFDDEDIGTEDLDNDSNKDQE
jgi:hypothetical protein